MPLPLFLEQRLSKWANNKLKSVGVSINGSDPWDVQVHDSTMFLKAIVGGSLAFGECYQRGLWDCEKLDELIARIRGGGMNVGGVAKIIERLFFLTRKLRLQTKKRAERSIAHHYDISNRMYRLMLGPTMQYSCAYFEDGPLARRLYGHAAATLDEAQVAKLSLIAEKLQLRPGLRVLDVGCGFGYLARFLAEIYGVKVVGITLSKEQADGARLNCEGLDVDIRVMDYRDVPEMLGQFDRIVSVGMFEHVGPPFYRTYMQAMFDSLKPGGIFVFHTITGHGHAERWINKYIFPDGIIPSLVQIEGAIAGLFREWDRHAFGKSYGKTLRAWWGNFDSAWSQFEGEKHTHGMYDTFFYRTWRYYLLACAGLFDCGYSNLHQFVLAKEAAPASYERVR